jgi:signal transduction histidine kinase
MPRRASWQLLIAGTLLVLLAALATLQYRWLGQVSDAERERLRVGLKTRAAAFAEEFDRGLTRTYMAFRTNPDRFDQEPAAFLADAVTRQASPDAGPVLVKDVYLVDARQTPPGLQRLNAGQRTLERAEWPAALESWRARADHFTAALPGGVGVLPPMFMSDAIDAATPALIIPMARLKRVNPAGRLSILPDLEAAGRVVIVLLDADTLQHQLLEPLVAKHFGDARTSDYNVTIVSRDTPRRVVYSAGDAPVDAGSADVVTGLFDLRMNEVNRLVSSELPRQPPGMEKVAITIVRRANGADGTRVLMTGGEGQGAWQVLIRGRSGSLETLVTQSRHRNLAISLGVLALLAGSFVLIIGSAQRQQRLARQQMEFVASVSHELRTPLAVIWSAGENLADGVVADSQQVKRYGLLVQTEGRRLADMVERVMEFAGITSGTIRHASAEVDIPTVVVDAVGGANVDGRERGVTVSVTCAAAVSRVMGDADALRSAVQNIVGNAVKYSQAGGAVDVRVDVDDAGVRIEVTDRGLGIDAQDLAHIFKPFFRGRRAVDAQVRGAGVGLSVVRHVVDAHQGRIRVDSRAGEGTTVVVVLPAAPSSAQPHDVPALAERRDLQARHRG